MDGAVAETFSQQAVGVALFALDMTMTRANPKLCEILGYEEHELIGRGEGCLLHPDDRASGNEILGKLAAGDIRHFAEERRYVRRDGSVRWLAREVWRVRGAPGQTDFVVGFYHDLSAWQGDRGRLEASEAKFRSYVEHAPIGICVIDEGGRYLDVNPCLLQILGYERDDLLRLTAPETVAEADRDRALENLSALAVNRTCHAEYRFNRRDGTEIPLELNAVWLGADRYLTYMQDISVRYQAEAEIRERLRLHEQIIRITASVPGMIYAFRKRPDGSTSFPFAAPHMKDLLGLDPATVREDGELFLARVAPEDRITLLETAKVSMADLSCWMGVYRYNHPVKGQRWIESRSVPRLEPDGSVVWDGFAADITDRKRDEAALRDANAVVASTDEAVIILDLKGIVISVNAAFCSRSGYAEEEVIGRPIAELRTIDRDSEVFAEIDRRVQETGSVAGEIWYRRKTGEIAPASLTVRTIHDEWGQPVRRVAILNDLSLVKQQERKLEELANNDALTGLPNRVVFRRRLGQAVDRARNAGRRGAVLFLGLDRFKSVNDSLGHAVGDEVLRTLSTRIRGRLREVDTLARLGGDEFAIAIEDLSGPEDAASVARGLIAQVLEPVTLSDDREIVIGASIGISIFPDDGHDVDELVRHAGAALHQAKAEGPGVARLFTLDLTRDLTERFDLESRLRRAIDRREFILHYQPLIRLSDGALLGVEALVRWDDPERGRIPPNQFIGLAEETGLIAPLGEWVLRTACAQMQAWRGSGMFDGFVAVNLSPIQFRQSDFVNRVAAILTETGLPGTSLELELTEGALIGEVGEARAIIDQLSALGVRLAIDDFGTGYSSLAYLKRFSIDKLKIDQSFVREIPNDTADMEIATAIISMARSLRLESLAEGIETEAQLEFLEKCGCDSGQGYFIARPMPPEALADFLARSDAA